MHFNATPVGDPGSHIGKMHGVFKRKNGMLSLFASTRLEIEACLRFLEENER